MTAIQLLRGALCTATFVGFAAGSVDARADAESVDAPYVARPEHDLSTLMELVRRRSPGLQVDLLAADLARAGSSASLVARARGRS